MGNKELLLDFKHWLDNLKGSDSDVHHNKLLIELYLKSKTLNVKYTIKNYDEYKSKELHR